MHLFYTFTGCFVQDSLTTNKTNKQTNKKQKKNSTNNIVWIEKVKKVMPQRRVESSKTKKNKC